MVSELIIYSCIIVGVVLCMWIMSKVAKIIKLSEVYDNQKYSYMIVVFLVTGKKYCFQWYSDYLYKSVTDLLESTSVKKEKKLVFQYQEEEILIEREKIVSIEMKVENENTEKEGK